MTKGNSRLTTCIARTDNFDDICEQSFHHSSGFLRSTADSTERTEGIILKRTAGLATDNRQKSADPTRQPGPHNLSKTADSAGLKRRRKFGISPDRICLFIIAALQLSCLQPIHANHAGGNLNSGMEVYHKYKSTKGNSKLPLADPLRSNYVSSSKRPSRHRVPAAAAGSPRSFSIIRYRNVTSAESNDSSGKSTSRDDGSRRRQHGSSIDTETALSPPLPPLPLSRKHSSLKENVGTKRSHSSGGDFEHELTGLRNKRGGGNNQPPSFNARHQNRFLAIFRDRARRRLGSGTGGRKISGSAFMVMSSPSSSGRGSSGGGNVVGYNKRETGGLGGMSLSITDNLDTLRRRLLRELSLRQREQDRRKLMMKNQDFLVEIG